MLDPKKLSIAINYAYLLCYDHYSVTAFGIKKSYTFYRRIPYSPPHNIETKKVTKRNKKRRRKNR